MKNIFTSSWFALTFAARTAPRTLGAVLLLQLVLAGFPAAQVWLVSALGRAIETRSAHTYVLAFCVALLIAGFLSLQDISSRLGDILRLNIAWMGRKTVDHKVSRLPPERLAHTETNKQVRQALEVVSNGNLSVQATAVTSVIFAVTVAVSLFVSIVQFNVWTAMFTILALIPSLVVNFYCSRRLAEQWEQNNDYHRHANYLCEQMIYKEPATELALLDAREWFRAEAETYRDKVASLDRSVHTMYIRTELYNSLATIACFGLALLAFVRTDTLTAVQATATLVGISSGLFAIHNVGWSVGMLMQETTPLLMLQRFFNSPEVEPPLPVIETSEQLRVEKLFVTDILYDVNLTAHQGQLIAIVGPNGAGKTTLVSALVGTRPIAAGTVTIDGHDITHASFAEKHRYFGMLPQDYSRFGLTVAQNLRLGGPGDPTEALRISGADAFVHDLDQQLGEQWGGVGLSGGQWQRLSLARLRLRNPGIWILDEPTSSIDAHGEMEIFAELRRISGNKIVIVVSHRASTLRMMDKIYFLSNGRITESGTFDELYAKGGEFTELFTSQIEGVAGAADPAGPVENEQPADLGNPSDSSDSSNSEG